MTHNQVMKAWLEARPAKSPSLTTDGMTRFSYALPIARYRWSDDRPSVSNYTARDNGVFISHTTSKHVGQAVRFLQEEGKEYDLLPPQLFEEREIDYVR